MWCTVFLFCLLAGKGGGIDSEDFFLSELPCDDRKRKKLTLPHSDLSTKGPPSPLPLRSQLRKKRPCFKKRILHLPFRRNTISLSTHACGEGRVEKTKGASLAAAAADLSSILVCEGGEGPLKRRRRRRNGRTNEPNLLLSLAEAAAVGVLRGRGGIL